MAPATHYAHHGSVAIAWADAGGDAPLDLLFLPGLISHVEHAWEEPGLAAFFGRLGTFARLIVMDRRGTGLSDPLNPECTLDDEVGDVLAVLDAAGSERAVLLGYTTGGTLAVRCAAGQPERVRALVLYASTARSLFAPDYEWAFDTRRREENFERLIAGWGTGANLDQVAPSRADDERLRGWLARLERLSSSPGELRTIAGNLGDNDVRADLAELRVPTLILHRANDRLIDVRHSRYLAQHIPGARYVELEGIDNLPSAGDSQAILGEIEEFLTGGRARSRERALLTVLVSDIVDSTGHAARLGDARWRELLAAHDSAVRREIDRFDGREVKTIGDGFLASFDGAPSRALRCAAAIRDAVTVLGLQVRVGLHTGECELLGDDLGGMAVHIAARVAAEAAPGEVLASGTAYGTVVGSGLAFTDRGIRQLKGVPGAWPLFALDP